MDFLTDYWPFFVPLIIAELALAVSALIHVLRNPRYRFGSKTVWILVVLAVQIIGPVVYFIIGRGEE